MKKMILIIPLILMLINCSSLSKDVGILDLKYGMSQQQFRSKIPDPDNVIFLGELGLLKTDFKNNKLVVVKFVRYPVTEDLRVEYKKFLGIYYKMRKQYGKPDKHDLLNSNERRLVYILEHYKIEYYAKWIRKNDVVEIRFEYIDDMDLFITAIQFQKRQ